MLNFGTLKQSGGAGGGGLWKLITLPSSNIEPDVTAGALGVEAPSSADGNLYLLSGLAAFVGSYPFAGGAANDIVNSEIIFAGVVHDLAGYKAVHGAISTATAAASKWNAFLDALGNGYLDASVKPAAGSGGGEFFITFDASNNGELVFQATDNTGNNYQLQLDSNNFSVFVNGNLMFRIASSGAIWTKSVVAGAPLGVMTKKMPIYDELGVLQGYVGLFN